MGQDVDFAGHDLASGAQVANHGDHETAGGHEDHQMAGGGMVAGLAMAHIGPDRDGLALDVLEVSLGPVLPGWPTGLVLRGSLQGDVFAAVTLSWADAVTPAAPAGDAAPRALDLLGRFLLVAGASTMARLAGAARDDMRASDPARAARGRRAAAEVALRVRRSRATAWSVRGLGARPGMTTSGSDRTSPVGDDVWDRVRGWCDVVVRRVASDDGTLGRSPANDGRATDRIDLVSLAQLLEGTELAGARLVVASFDLAAAPSAAAERTRG